MGLPEPPWDLIGTPAWIAWFDNQHCPFGHQGIDWNGPAKAPHFGVYACRDPWCEWHTYMPKPKTLSEQKKRRPSRAHEHSSDDRCATCGLTRDELEMLGRQLQVCHIVDRAELIEAGLPPDDPSNEKLLCNFCHEDEQAKRRDAKRLVAALRAAA